MNVIARPAIDEAIKRHANAATWLNAWWKTAGREQWTNLGHIRETYPRTDQVGSCLVFDVLGNKYRMIVGVRYASATRGGTLFVKHFLTHTEYDKHAWRKDCKYAD
jgi:mRNA-degrading endonuclease HigB of HigAB toxin-antitoxin module